jgi:RNA polymerase sigma-70 factor, ECF subfamily
MAAERPRGERALAERARGGDLEAYAALVVAHRGRLFASAFARTGHREDALDAVSDAVLHGIDAVRGLREPEAFGLWMARLVRSACNARLERAHRRFEVAADEGAVEASPSAGAAAPAEADPVTRLWLDELLRALPEPHATVLHRFYLSGMTVGELSRSLGRPAGTIKRWLAEARAMALRRSISMSGTALVVGEDLTDAERGQIEAAMRANTLVCDHRSDVFQAHSAMVDELPAIVVVGKRMDGPCDAFALLAMMKHGTHEGLTKIPVIALGPHEDKYVFALWCAGAHCCLSRPFDPAELQEFTRRILAAASAEA